MRRRVWRWGWLTLLAAWAASASTQELDWAQRMFSELEHDFGVVARGADVRHRIFVKNLYQETVTIADVSSSCGCTSARASQTVLPSGETAYIELVLDTKNHMKQKDPNIDVRLTFDGINFKTVRIPIHVYIRSDVVIQPGAVEFGSVDLGAGATQRLSIAYAGRDDWQIREVRCNREMLKAAVQEKHRGGGRVDYELVVQLDPAAPEGTFRDQLLLITDDAGNPFIPLAVSATIEPDIVMGTPEVPLGNLKPGVPKTVTAVIRGRRPFVIEKIECESDRECFKVKLPKDPKSVHVLPLTVTPPEEKGKFTEEFTVTIAGRSQPLTFRAQGWIE